LQVPSIEGEPTHTTAFDGYTLRAHGFGEDATNREPARHFNAAQRHTFQDIPASGRSPILIASESPGRKIKEEKESHTRMN
jgi:hypothetical protein